MDLEWKRFMIGKETIKDYHGRIWLVDSENLGLYHDEFRKKKK